MQKIVIFIVLCAYLILGLMAVKLIKTEIKTMEESQIVPYKELAVPEKTGPQQTSIKDLTAPEDELAEDPLEELHTKQAVIASIGKSNEKEAFGYDFSYVCRVVMAEAGGNSDEYQTAIATCIYNACAKEGFKYYPDEICRKYKYAAPALAASDRVIQNTLDVLYLGNVNECIEDAVYFYAPKHCQSDWHEQQTFIIEMEGGRFFK